MTEEQLRREMERIERDNDLAAMRERLTRIEATLKETLAITTRMEKNFAALSEQTNG